VTATDAAHLRRKNETYSLLRDTIGKTSTKDYGHVDACGNPGHLVALIGDAGAGKSSLVNAINNVLHICSLQGSDETRHWQPPCFVGQGNGNGTGEAGFVTLADGFTMVDTRGYAEHGEGTVAEIRSIATHGIADRQNFVRNGVVSGQRSERTRLAATRHVAALAYVHNAEMPVAAETLDSYNAAVRGNQKPVVVLTHIDRLSAEELVKARDDAMQLFGVADSHLFEVKHVTRNRDTDQFEPDHPNQMELLRLVVTLLTESERFMPEKNLDGLAFATGSAVRSSFRTRALRGSCFS
jgi:GTP-binding protein EngB required for normal cell division